MTCEQCRTELEPVMTICPGCGSRVGSASKRGQVDWREQVRERVERHKQKRRLQQEKRNDEARQLSIFPEAVPEDDDERRERERRAEIRARVEERVLKRRHDPFKDAFFDRGEVSVPRRGQGAAAARQLRRDPEPETERELPPEPEIDDRSTAELEPIAAAELRREDDLASDEADFDLGEGLDERGDDLDSDSQTSVRHGLASAGERILGGIIDVAFVALIQLTLFYLTTHLVANGLGALPTSAVVAMVVVGVVLAAGYFLFFWSLSGQTLGKLLTGARVVDRRGGPLGFGRAGVRLLGAIVAALPLCAGFLGLWTDPERRGWHDRIAGTKVVRG